MKQTRGNKNVNHSLFSVRGYLGFFLLISFVVTSCFFLFLGSVDLRLADIQRRAVVTLINVFFLSLLATLFDGARRKMTMEKPIKQILEATHQFAEGDFSARIQPLHSMGDKNEFDVIIDNFNTMAEELAGVETLRTDFIANVSHELKTPLAIIQNYGTMLQNPGLPAQKQVEYAKTITDASRRLSDLITNILKLNKLENQQIFPEKQAYNLSEQLCECLLDFEDVWEKKNLDIENDIAENVMVQADAELLRLVWNNLFSNAMKFTPAGGRVAVRLREVDGNAAVQVADTGCGMTPEVGAHIFEKFYQGDKSHAMQGNGLGLPLVKRVVDIMGGEISVESAMGQGSTFTIILRRNEDETG